MKCSKMKKVSAFFSIGLLTSLPVQANEPCFASSGNITKVEFEHNIPQNYLFPQNGFTEKQFLEKVSDSPCSNRIKRKVYEISKESNINPFLIMSIIEIESTCNTRATSSVGARGLMQIMPSAEQEYRRITGQTFRASKYDIDYNIRVGTVYLKHLIDVYNQDLHSALVHYNAGGRLHRRAQVSGGIVCSRYSNNVVMKANSFI